MTHLLRLISSFVLVLMVVAGLASAAGAQGSFAVRQPSPTGSFLAGQQALNDLRTREAANYFAEAARTDWDNPLVVDRSFFALAADGQVQRSADVARHLLELDPQNELARVVVAAEALKQRRYRAAIDELEPMGTDSFAGITGAILRAWAYVGDKKTDEAFALMDKLGEDGLEEFLVFHRALMLDVSGDNEGAIEFAARAYESDPMTARLVEAYSRMLANAGRFDEAAAVIAEYEARGVSYPLVDEVQAAIEERRRPGQFVSGVQSGAAEMLHGIGMALARDGSLDGGMLFLQLARYLDADADVYPLAVAQIYDFAGQHDAANAIYDAVPETSPLKPTAVVRVAANLETTGDRTEAIRRLRNIVTAAPDDLDAVSVLGDLLRNDEQYVEAAEAYSQAIDLAEGDLPGDWQFYYRRGIAYERAKQWDKAEADFLRALELNPDQPQVLNYLGYTWVDRGENLQPALEMIEKAVAGAPNDGYIIDSLGWAFYRLGRYDEAVQVLEQAVQLLPNDPEINDHLGDAYWRAGRQLEARFQWNVASSVDEEGNVRERVLPKLAGGLDNAPVTEDSAPISGDAADASE